MVWTQGHGGGGLVTSLDLPWAHGPDPTPAPMCQPEEDAVCPGHLVAGSCPDHRAQP